MLGRVAFRKQYEDPWRLRNWEDPPADQRLHDDMTKRSDVGEDRFRKRADREKDLQKQRPGADDDPLPPPTEPIRSEVRPDRNDPCPCGSGKKYKRCCGRAGA